MPCLFYPSDILWDGNLNFRHAGSNLFPINWKNICANHFKPIAIWASVNFIERFATILWLHYAKVSVRSRAHVQRIVAFSQFPSHFPKIASIPVLWDTALIRSESCVVSQQKCGFMAIPLRLFLGYAPPYIRMLYCLCWSPNYEVGNYLVRTTPCCAGNLPTESSAHKLNSKRRWTHFVLQWIRPRSPIWPFIASSPTASGFEVLNGWRPLTQFYWAGGADFCRNRGRREHFPRCLHQVHGVDRAHAHHRANTASGNDYQPARTCMQCIQTPTRGIQLRGGILWSWRPRTVFCTTVCKDESEHRRHASVVLLHIQDLLGTTCYPNQREWVVQS